MFKTQVSLAPAAAAKTSAGRAARALGLAALSAGAFSTTRAEAQFPNLLEVGARYLPGVELPDLPPARAQVASYDAAVNVPVVLGASTFLVPGLAYHVDAVSYSNAPPGFVDLRAFHSLEMPVLFVQLLPRDWALSLRGSVGLASDSVAFERDQVRLGAVLLATHAFSDSLVVGGGGIGSYAFGSFLPLPAAYVEYRPLEALVIESFLPAFVDVRYRAGDRVRVAGDVGAHAELDAVRDPRVASAWPCRGTPDDLPPDSLAASLGPDDCFDHVAYSVGHVGAVAAVRLFGSFWLEVYGGHTLFRILEQRNADDELVTGGLEPLPEAFFLSTSVQLRIPRE